MINRDVEIKLVRNTVIPGYKTLGANAVDLRACVDKPVVLRPGDRKMIPSGIAVSIQDPCVAGVIIPRSGLGSKGLVLSNLVGLIDSDYQGEIMIAAWNSGTVNCAKILPGARIAQMMFIPTARARFSLVSDFSSETERGANGFGSTGAQ